LNCHPAQKQVGGIRTGAVHVCRRTRQLGAPSECAIRCAKLAGTKSGLWQEIQMLDPKIFEELNSRFAALVAASPAKDIEKNVKAMLASVFEKMDLVTREEFDIQAQLLARTREKLTALEARVTELEKSAKQ
jgi:BMFP domain-containing protein YqiC